MKNRRTPSARDRQFERVRHTAQGILVLAGVATGTGVGLIAHGAKAATATTSVPPATSSTTTTTPSSTTTPTTSPGQTTPTTLYVPPVTAPVTTTTVCYSTPSGNVNCY